MKLQQLLKEKNVIVSSSLVDKNEYIVFLNYQERDMVCFLHLFEEEMATNKEVKIIQQLISLCEDMQHYLDHSNFGEWLQEYHCGKMLAEESWNIWKTLSQRAKNFQILLGDDFQMFLTAYQEDKE